MTLFEYLLLIPPVLAQMAIGRRLVRGDAFGQLLAGLLVSAAIVGPLAYLQVSWIRPILVGLTILGLALAVFDLNRLCKAQRQGLLRRRSELVLLAALLVFFLWFFRGLHYTNYTYESHDLLYFSAVSEFLKGDYPGPVRVGIAWPLLMASNHLLPAALLSVLSIAIPNPTLVTSVEIRYMLVAAAFAWFLYGMLPRQPKTGAVYGLVFLLLFSIFREEIAYELRISSFVYICVLLQILKRLLSPDSDDQGLVFLAIMLIIAKAPILFLAASLAGWLLLKGRHIRWTPATWMAIGLVVINVFGWTLAPPPQGRSLFWTVAHPANLRGIWDLNGITEWIIPDTVLLYLQKTFASPFITLPVVCYVWVKYYGVYIFARDRLIPPPFAASSAELPWQVKMQALDVFVLSSLFSWIILRNGYAGVSHQAHAFLLTSVVTVMVMLQVLVVRLRQWTWIILIALAVLYAGRVDVSDPFQYVNGVTRGAKTAATYGMREPMVRSADDFYKPPSGESPGISQVKAAMAGQRLSIADVEPTLEAGVMYYWIVK